MLQLCFFLRGWIRRAELNFPRFTITDRYMNTSSMDSKIVLHSSPDDHLLDRRNALIDCRDQLQFGFPIGDDFDDELFGCFFGPSLSVGQLQPVTHRFPGSIRNRVLRWVLRIFFQQGALSVFVDPFGRCNRLIELQTP